MNCRRCTYLGAYEDNTSSFIIIKIGNKLQLKLNPNKINRNSLYIKFLNQSICVLSIFSFSIKSKYSDLMERIKNNPELSHLILNE